MLSDQKHMRYLLNKRQEFQEKLGHIERIQEINMPDHN